MAAEAITCPAAPSAPAQLRPLREARRWRKRSERLVRGECAGGTCGGGGAAAAGPGRAGAGRVGGDPSPDSARPRAGPGWGPPPAPLSARRRGAESGAVGLGCGAAGRLCRARPRRAGDRARPAGLLRGFVRALGPGRASGTRCPAERGLGATQQKTKILFFSPLKIKPAPCRSRFGSPRFGRGWFVV